MNSSEKLVNKVQGRSTITLLICVILLAAAVCFVVPRVMIHMMVLDEQAKAKLKYDESLKPNLSTEVEIVTGPKKRPMGAGGPGPSPVEAPVSNETKNDSDKE